MEKIKVVVLGACGRMGKNILKSAYNNDNIELVGAIVQSVSQLEGKDIGSSIGESETGIKFSYSLNDLAGKYDVAIDFTSPRGTYSHISICLEHKTAMIIGTTGFSETEKEFIKEAAKQIPIVFSANFSVGTNLLFKLVEKASLVMHDADIEIIEAHHRHKLDAPSGTALSIAEYICNATDRELNKVAVFNRHDTYQKRTKEEIGFSVIRGSDIVGEHSVWFCVDGERVEISHKASDRITFANGAIRAALWLSVKPAGKLYSMVDVLSLECI